MTVVGVERVDYTSKKSGRPVKGWRVHMTETRDNVYGMETSSEFVSEKIGKRFFDQYPNLEAVLGQEIRISYRKSNFGGGAEVDYIEAL